MVAGLPEQKIRVISPDVGGGFGNKVGVYPGYVLSVVGSLLTGKPVSVGGSVGAVGLLRGVGRGRLENIPRKQINVKEEGGVTNIIKFLKKKDQLRQQAA